MSTRVVMQIETGNAAFEDNPQELQGVIRQAARKVSDSRKIERIDSKLRDTNGNTIGFIKATDEEFDPVEGYIMVLETGNDALQDTDQLADLLNEYAPKLQEGVESVRLRDLNGNTVGSIEQTQEEPTHRPRP